MNLSRYFFRLSSRKRLVSKGGVVLSLLVLTAACSANFNDNNIAQVNLWRGMFPNGTLIDSEDLN